MKMKIFAPLALAATAAAAIGLAPVAAAGVSVVQTPGNAQVTATPDASALLSGLHYPWFGYGYGYGYGGGSSFHHGGHR